MSVALSTDRYLGRLALKLAAATGFIVLLVLVLLSLVAMQVFQSQMAPALDAKSRLLGEQLRDTFDNALSFGLPIEQLVGVPPVLERVLRNHPELAFVRVWQQERVLYEAVRMSDRPVRAIENFRTPLQSPNAYLVLAVDADFVARQQWEVVYDILTSLVIALLVTLEVLLAVLALTFTEPLRRLLALIHQGVGGPLQGLSPYQAGGLGSLATALNRAVSSAQGSVPLQHSRSVSAMRLALFIFFFGSELPRSFLPILASTLHQQQPHDFLSAEFAAALPFTTYLLCFMAATPLGGVLSQRFSPRQLFLIGLLPSAVGYLGTFFAQDVLFLALWRGLNGMGYAIASVAALDYFTGQGAGPSYGRRAQSTVAFFGASMVAGISGSAIGGLLADRIGYDYVFLLAMLLTLGSAMFVWRALESIAPPRTVMSRLGLPVGTLLRNRRFNLLVLLSAMPTQLVLNGFLFYMAPLYLLSLGNDSAAIGRVVMIYFVGVLLFAGPMARYADRGQHHGLLMGLGSTLSGLGLLLLFLIPDSTWLVAFAVLVLATGNAMVLPNQLSVLQGATAYEQASLGAGSVIGVYRLLERGGALLGPLLAAYSTVYLGYAQTAVLMGGLATTCGLLFLASLDRSSRPH